jgi:hypothetical protein
MKSQKNGQIEFSERRRQHMGVLNVMKHKGLQLFHFLLQVCYRVAAASHAMFHIHIFTLSDNSQTRVNTTCATNHQPGGHQGIPNQSTLKIKNWSKVTYHYAYGTQELFGNIQSPFQS